MCFLILYTMDHWWNIQNVYSIIYNNNCDVHTHNVSISYNSVMNYRIYILKVSPVLQIQNLLFIVSPVIHLPRKRILGEIFFWKYLRKLFWCGLFFKRAKYLQIIFLIKKGCIQTKVQRVHSGSISEPVTRKLHTNSQPLHSSPWQAAHNFISQQTPRTNLHADL